MMEMPSGARKVEIYPTAKLSNVLPFAIASLSHRGCDPRAAQVLPLSSRYFGATFRVVRFGADLTDVATLPFPFVEVDLLADDAKSRSAAVMP